MSTPAYYGERQKSSLCCPAFLDFYAGKKANGHPRRYLTSGCNLMNPAPTALEYSAASACLVRGARDRVALRQLHMHVEVRLARPNRLSSCICSIEHHRNDHARPAVVAISSNVFSFFPRRIVEETL